MDNTTTYKEILEGNQHLTSVTWNLISRFQVLLAVAVGYLSLVRVLRYRRVSKMKARFPNRQSLAKMTIKEAQDIVMQVAQYEMPFAQKKAAGFALFRTYGIPSISTLLSQTGIFTKPESASKRYADTVMLLQEQIGRTVGSKNWTESTARMNCIHKKYQDAGKISNSDMIFTISLFIREPISWIKRFEWRELSEVEKCGLAIYWSFQGEVMGIEWRGFPTYDAGKKWTDGLHFLDEMLAWCEDYEASYMIPADTNFQTAEETTAILLWNVPASLKPFGKKVVAALMDDRLRLSMKYPAPPKWIVSMVYSMFRIRAFLIRHAFLPRFSWTAYHGMTDHPDKDGRYFSLDWDALPYYVKPTLLNRWGPMALMSRVNKVALPGDEQRFCPMGYTIPDLGPSHGARDQKAMEGKVKHIGERGHIYFEGLAK